MKTLSNAGKSEYLEIPNGENAQVQTISKVDLAWLAGIIEGEGHLVIYYRNEKTSMNMQIGVTNSDARMIRRVSEIYTGLNLKYFYSLKSPSKRNSKRWCLTIIVGTYGSCRKLLNILIPYLHSKLDQAMNMVEFANYRLSLFDNHKGQSRDAHGAYSKNGPTKYGEKDHHYWQKQRDLKHPPIDLQRLQRKASHSLHWDDGIV